MKKSTRVTLISLLVYPGIGHVLLKKYFIAILFILSFTYLLTGIISNIISKSQLVLDKVAQGKIPLELNAINEALMKQGSFDSQSQSISVYLMFAIWLFAAFDCYRIAKNHK